MMSTEFLITSLVVVLLPGTGVLYTVSVGLSRGFVASAWAAVGCTLGIVPHMLAAIFGLAAVLHASAVVFQAFKIVGVLYLLYLAVGIWRDRSGFKVDTEQAAGAHRACLFRGFLINILNPKLSVFFLAFLPQFIDPVSATPLPDMLMLSAVFMAMTLAVFVVYGGIAHNFRRWIVDSAAVQQWLRVGFASAFAALAVRLAVSDR